MSEEELIEELSSLFNDIENDERYTDTIYRNITYLQQENKQLKVELQEANDNIIWWSNRFNAVERDNKQLKEQLENDIDRYEDTISYQLGFDKGKEYLQQRIDKAIEYIKNNTHKIEWGDIESQDEESIDINDDTTETEFIEQLLEILGDKENE